MATCCLVLLPAPALIAGGPTLRPVVEVEEDVYRFTDAGNGAGPMWCAGSTCLVRSGGEVFASGLETLPDTPPPNNCRWILFRRGPAGWERLRADDARTREPAPLAVLPGDRVLVSVNPTVAADPSAKSGPARPDVLQFSAAQLEAPPLALAPVWEGNPRFTEHSYRSFAADGSAGEVVLFQNVGYTHAEWTFRDAAGRWSARGRLTWPWGAEYDKPQPIRVCYPAVAVQRRAVHFCGVSDIVEPYRAWRELKRAKTGRDWDYDFRRLFYTWTPDVTTAPFAPWVEIASHDKTCGWIMPGDLWLAPNGDVHLLWTERALDERLRPVFFPAEKQSHALNHAVVRAGRVVHRQTLVESTEDRPGLVASAGRFHATPDGRLFVVCFVSGRAAEGARVAENRILEVLPEGTAGTPVRLPFAQPFRSFFTATVRAGSPPSSTLELLGPRTNTGNTISYARVRLF